MQTGSPLPSSVPAPLCLGEGVFRAYSTPFGVAISNLATGVTAHATLNLGDGSLELPEGPWPASAKGLLLRYAAAHGFALRPFAPDTGLA